MSVHNWLGKTYDGYQLREIAASGDDEVLFEAERVRDGDYVWIRAPRTDDPTSHSRLAARYQAEREAAAELHSGGCTLAVREIIDMDGFPALVTDRPQGRSLIDLFSERVGPWPLAETLEWFKRVVATLESAHAMGAAHGSLSGRAVYIGERGRLTVCGLAFMPPDQMATAAARDTLALSKLLYRATTGIAPSAGFPYTGQPQSPSVLVEGYPPTLARFLVKRLDEETKDDPVSDAGVFRRSLDAMEVDPEFRRRAGMSTSSSPDVIIEHSSRLVSIKSPVWWVFGTAVLCGISMVLVYLVMQARVDQASKQARTPSGVAAAPVPVPPEEDGRLSAWKCLHAPFVPGGPGSIAPSRVAECLQKAPDATRTELHNEAARLALALDAMPLSGDARKSRDEGYHRLFNLGADEVAQHLSYRFDRHLPVGKLESWIRGSQTPHIRGILADLSQRTGSVGDWARRQLTQLTPTAGP